METMKDIVDPMDGLNSLQTAMDQRLVQLTQCELYQDLQVLYDEINGHQMVVLNY